MVIRKGDYVLVPFGRSDWGTQVARVESIEHTIARVRKWRDNSRRWTATLFTYHVPELQPADADDIRVKRAQTRKPPTS